MGLYDTYGDVQLKVGERVLANYEIGDEVEISDGVYVAPDGVVVIVDHKFVAVYDHLVSKWGEKIFLCEVLTD